MTVEVRSCFALSCFCFCLPRRFRPPRQTVPWKTQKILATVSMVAIHVMEVEMLESSPREYGVGIFGIQPIGPRNGRNVMESSSVDTEGQTVGDGILSSRFPAFSFAATGWPATC